MALGTTVLSVVGLIAAIWVIYDTWAVNRKDSTGMKVVWTILAILFSIITAIIYYLVRKR